MHTETERVEEMAPSKALLHFHPLTVLKELFIFYFFAYPHQSMPIILFFTLLALLPDAEVL